MAKVSIIVAAYNVEEYIREAMDSSVNQTMQDIEIIAVDDHSTDGTVKILAAYAAKDSRVKVIVHEENKGSLAVRHTGVMASSGKYVLFIDGDDYLVPNACECLYQDITIQHLDILDFGISVFSDYKCKTDNDTLHAMEESFSHSPNTVPQNRAELMRACFGNKKEVRWNLCGKMYTLSLLKKAYSFFNGEQIYMAEDLLISFMAFYYARSYGYKRQKFYCYRVGNGISTNSMPPTTQKLTSIATEYQVYPLLCKWLSRHQRKERGVSGALAFIRARTHEDILYYFLHRAAPEDCPTFLQAILKYCSLEEFIGDLIDYLEKEKTPNAEDVALRLRDCAALSPQTKTVKTVASFYYRLYNGGVERVMAQLAPIWQKAGYRVVIVTEEEANPLDYPLAKGVYRAVLPSANGKGKKRLQAWQSIIHDYQIDAVVYHAWMYDKRFYDALAIKSQGVPFILHTHGLATFAFSHPEYTNMYQEASDALSDAVITLSEEDEAWWRSLGFCSRYTFNPLTYQPAEVIPSSLQGHDGIWLGRLSPEKQYYDAFEIARLVRQKVSDFRLHVIGKAESDSAFLQIQQYIADHNMSSYVLLHGYHTDVTSFFQRSSVMLFTSILEFEGAPMSIMEGKAFGVPLVTYELANVAAIRAGKGMYIVRQRDMQAAADHIIQLLEDSELRRKMGAEARQSAEEVANFDFAEHWREIFELSMEPRKPHKPLYQLPPMDAALRTAMRLVARGAHERAKVMDNMNSSGPHMDMQPKRSKQMQQPVYKLDRSHVRSSEQLQQLAYENAAYAAMVKEIRNSTAYKIGSLLTTIPRKLKQLFSNSQ